jgi:ABC-2 type transport system permease protein
MINGISGAFIGPIILVIMFSTQSSSSDLVEFYSVMNNPDYAMYVALIGLGLILFTGGMNLVASTAVSREGKNFWISKMIPVSAERQV